MKYFKQVFTSKKEGEFIEVPYSDVINAIERKTLCSFEASKIFRKLEIASLNAGAKINKSIDIFGFRFYQEQ